MIKFFKAHYALLIIIFILASLIFIFRYTRIDNSLVRAYNTTTGGFTFEMAKSQPLPPPGTLQITYTWYGYKLKWSDVGVDSVKKYNLYYSGCFPWKARIYSGRKLEFHHFHPIKICTPNYEVTVVDIYGNESSPTIADFNF